MAMQVSTLNDRTVAFIHSALREGLPLPLRWLWLPYRNSLLSGAQFEEADASRFRKISWGLASFAILALILMVDEWAQGRSGLLPLALLVVFLFLLTCTRVARLGLQHRSLVKSLVPEAGFTYDRSAAGPIAVWAGLGVAAYWLYGMFF